MALLEVEDLVVEFRGRDGVVRAVDGATFDLAAGETLGLVGESGSGKSVTALTILGLLPRNARVVRGSARIEGRDIVSMREPELQGIRGRVVSMVLQDPMTSLNPVFTIGWQVGEAVQTVTDLRGAALHTRVIDLLTRMHVAAPEDRVHAFPHQMSGGMRQRAVGAIALAGPPRILIADEPTTSLDVTVQAQYLQLLGEIKSQLGVAIIFITHDFGIVAEICDRVAVMYAGKIVEIADVFQLFDQPSHPYTRALLESVPQLGQSGRLRSIAGQPPSAGSVAMGCPFADAKCAAEHPPVVTVGEGHQAACWRLV